LIVAKKREYPDDVNSQPEIMRAPSYSKAKLISFERYRDRRDLLGALLDDGREYTTDEVDSAVADFLKG
jgi:hypothetical protein